MVMQPRVHVHHETEKSCGHKTCFVKARNNIRTKLLDNYKNKTGDRACCSSTMKQYTSHLKGLGDEELSILYEHELGKEPFYACLSPSTG